MDTIEHPTIYPVAVVAIVLSAFAIILDIPPLVWHFRNRNIAAWSLILWILILNVTVFCNAIIWPNDDFASWWDGQGLCDVEAKLFVGATVAIPGALACIMRGLAKVLDTNNTVVTTTKGDRRKRLTIDILFCFGCPIYFMAIHYVVQPIRYYIWGISGCNTPFDNSWVTISLIFIWPPILTLVDTYYGGLVIIRLYRYRRDLSGILQASNTTNSRFMRLFLMSLILILCILPVQFYVLAVNVAVPHTTYSWAEVHGPNWNQAVFIPSNGQIIFDRWIRIGCGFLVFFFFGVGTDAIKMYRSWLLALGFARVFTSLHPSARSQSSSRGTLNSLSTRLKQALGRRGSEHSPTSTLVAQQSIVEAHNQPEMKRTSTSQRWQLGWGRPLDWREHFDGSLDGGLDRSLRCG